MPTGDGFHGQGRSAYRCKTATIAEAADGVSWATLADGFKRAEAAPTGTPRLVPEAVDRVIIMNMGSENIFVRLVQGGGPAGDMIPVRAGGTLDTYGMLKDITDLEFTGTGDAGDVDVYVYEQLGGAYEGA